MLSNVRIVLASFYTSVSFLSLILPDLAPKYILNSSSPLHHWGWCKPPSSLTWLTTTASWLVLLFPVLPLHQSIPHTGARVILYKSDYRSLFLIKTSSISFWTWIEPVVWCFPCSSSQLHPTLLASSLLMLMLFTLMSFLSVPSHQLLLPPCLCICLFWNFYLQLFAWLASFHPK